MLIAKILKCCLQETLLASKASLPQISYIGGEICITSHALVCLSLYVYVVYVRPDNHTMPTRIVCTHSHLLLTMPRGNQISIETESERERDCTNVYQR